MIRRADRGESRRARALDGLGGSVALAGRRPCVRRDDRAQRAERTGIAFSLRVGAALAGSIGLHEIVRAHALGEVGYWLGTRFQHRGIMTRALDRIARFALGEYELHRLELHAAVDNAPSRAVAVRAGFAFEAILRERLRTARGFEDCAVYARLAG